MTTDTDIKVTGRPKKLVNAAAIAGFVEDYEKDKLQDIADKETGGNMSELLRRIAKEFLVGREG